MALQLIKLDEHGLGRYSVWTSMHTMHNAILISRDINPENWMVSNLRFVVIETKEEINIQPERFIEKVMSGDFKLKY